MQLIKFITIKNNKAICWCTTNEKKTFFNFMQYVLRLKNPQDFYILDVNNDKVYKMIDIANKQFKMKAGDDYIK